MGFFAPEQRRQVIQQRRVGPRPGGEHGFVAEAEALHVDLTAACGADPGDTEHVFDGADQHVAAHLHGYRLGGVDVHGAPEARARGELTDDRGQVDGRRALGHGVRAAPKVRDAVEHQVCHVRRLEEGFDVFAVGVFDGAVLLQRRHGEVEGLERTAQIVGQLAAERIGHGRPRRAPREHPQHASAGLPPARQAARPRRGAPCGAHGSTSGGPVGAPRTARGRRRRGSRGAWVGPSPPPPRTRLPPAPVQRRRRRGPPPRSGRRGPHAPRAGQFPRANRCAACSRARSVSPRGRGMHAGCARGWNGRRHHWTGRPSATQVPVPPSTFTAVKPALAIWSAARAERPPDWQMK